MKVKMEQTSILEMIKELTEGIEISNFFWYEPDVGYVNIDGIYLNGGDDAQINNCTIDYQRHLKITEKNIFKKTIDK